MDAKEFLIKQHEMCESMSLLSEGCMQCPVFDYCVQGQLQDMVEKLSDEDLAKYIDAVEEWSKRPKFTNADKFRKVFGLVLMPSHDHNGYLYFYKDAESRSINTALSSEEAVIQWLNTEYVEPDI